VALFEVHGLEGGLTTVTTTCHVWYGGEARVSVDTGRRTQMLLTIRTTHRPATDLGFLLHKHPDHVHTRDFPFGTATVFYPEATEEGCSAAVLLDVDPVGMVRGRGGK
jgi:Hen1-like subunit of RNA repair complex